MLRQQLRLCRRDLRVAPLDRFGDPRMQLPAAAVEQAVMRGIPHQRVLEGVARLRRAPTPENQPDGLELRQGVAEL